VAVLKWNGYAISMSRLRYIIFTHLSNRIYPWVKLCCEYRIARHCMNLHSRTAYKILHKCGHYTLVVWELWPRVSRLPCRPLCSLNTLGIGPRGLMPAVSYIEMIDINYRIKWKKLRRPHWIRKKHVGILYVFIYISGGNNGIPVYALPHESTRRKGERGPMGNVIWFTRTNRWPAFCDPDFCDLLFVTICYSMEVTTILCHLCGKCMQKMSFVFL